MAIDCTFLGHSGFILDSGEHRVAIDPFLTGNPIATMAADAVEASAICVTHGHGDHYADVPGIAKRTNAVVYAPFEICEHLGELGHERCEPANPGGTIPAPFGSVTFFGVIHSSSLNGRYLGPACGLVIEIGGVKVCHLGDTSYFSDLKLIGERYQPDVVMVPIGDRFTMDARDGSRAAEAIGAKIAIPIHYKTFPMLAQSADGFTPAGSEVREMQPGQTIQVG